MTIRERLTDALVDVERKLIDVATTVLDRAEDHWRGQVSRQDQRDISPEASDDRPAPVAEAFPEEADAPASAANTEPHDWDKPFREWAALLEPPVGYLKLGEAYQAWQDSGTSRPLSELLDGLTCRAVHMVSGQSSLPLGFVSSRRWHLDPKTGWARPTRMPPMLQYSVQVLVPEEQFLSLLGDGEPLQSPSPLPPPRRLSRSEVEEALAWNAKDLKRAEDLILRVRATEPPRPGEEPCRVCDAGEALSFPTRPRRATLCLSCANAIVGSMAARMAPEHVGVG